MHSSFLEASALIFPQVMLSEVWIRILCNVVKTPKNRATKIPMNSRRYKIVNHETLKTHSLLIKISINKIMAYLLTSRGI